jgi:hypothetical protein
MSFKTDCFSMDFSAFGHNQLEELRTFLDGKKTVYAVSLNSDTLAVTYLECSDLPLRVAAFNIPKAHAWGKDDKVTDRKKLQEDVQAWQEKTAILNLPFQVSNDSVLLIFYR